MHMSDALLSPAVGGGFWAVSAGAVGYAAARLKREAPGDTPALAGVMASFVFAAQMLNFSIPGTGSSGHLGGGMLLALSLGPWAGLIAIASVLIVQALFFADGGLLALGANVFNLGVIPCLLVLPLLDRFPGSRRGANRLAVLGAAGAWVALMLGAFMVVMQTLMSGRTELPFGVFAAAMLGIHSSIGLVEAAVTFWVVAAVARSRPAALGLEKEGFARPRDRRLVPAFLALAVIAGTFVSWFASTRPDGLEWSIARVSGSEELEGHASPLAETLGSIQERLAFLPDYAFPSGSEDGGGESGEAAWPAPDAGTSVSGLVGGLITFLLVLAASALMVRFRPAPVPAAVVPVAVVPAESDPRDANP